MLQRPDKLSYLPINEAIYGRVSLDLASTDKMFSGDHKHYLSVGASALNIIQAARVLGLYPKVETILDFGAGAGRVTRWLRAAYPDAAITVSDLRRPDIDFCAETFDTLAWQTGTEIEAMRAPHQFDLIWAGSVATHLPEDVTLALLRKFMSWLHVGGIAVVTLHGRYSRWRLDNEKSYVDQNRSQKIAKEYDASGYGYADHVNMTGYGISVCNPSWVMSAVQGIDHCKIVSYGERAWDRHQDVLAIQRTSGPLPA